MLIRRLGPFSRRFGGLTSATTSLVYWTARRRLGSSASSLIAVRSLLLQAPVSKVATLTERSPTASPKVTLAQARLLRVQAKLAYSKLNKTSEIHRERYPYLAEINITCFLPPTPSSTLLAASILPLLSTLLAPYSPNRQTQLEMLPTNLHTSVSAIFTFTRRINAIYDHTNRFWVENPAGETDTLQATTLVVLQAEEMLRLVRTEGKEDGGGFVEMVQQVKAFTGIEKGWLANGELADDGRGKGGRVICVVLGWSQFEGVKRKDHKWREKVLGDLVVKGGCFVHDVSTVEEATSFLWTTFGHIAVRRHARLDAANPFSAAPIKIRRTFDKYQRKGSTPLENFDLIHRLIDRGSPDKSRAITTEFGTLRRLLERYDEGRGERALKDLYPINEHGVPHAKKIGPAFSTRVHKIWTSTDPEEVI